MLLYQAPLSKLAVSAQPQTAQQRKAAMCSSFRLPIMLTLAAKLPESTGEKATWESNAQAHWSSCQPGGCGCSLWLCSILNSRAVQGLVCSLLVLAPFPVACFHGTKGCSEQGLLSLAETSPPATKSIHIKVPGSGLPGRKLAGPNFQVSIPV